MGSLTYIDLTLTELENKQLPPFRENITGPLEEAMQFGQEIEDDLEHVQSNVDLGDLLRESLTYFFISLPLLLALLGVLGAVAGHSSLIYPVALLGELLVTALCIVFVFHYSCSVVLSDTVVLWNRADAAGAEFTNVIINCQNSTELEQLKALTIEGREDLAEGMCYALGELCARTFPCSINGVAAQCPIVHCPADPKHNCSGANIFTYNQTLLADIRLGCPAPKYVDPDLCPASSPCNVPLVKCVTQPVYTIEECSVSCVNRTMRNVSILMLESFADLRAYDDLLSGYIIPLVDCEPITYMYKTVQHLINVDAIESGYRMAWFGAAGAVALCVLSGVAICATTQVSQPRRKPEHHYVHLQQEEPPTQVTLLLGGDTPVGAPPVEEPKTFSFSQVAPPPAN
eukprot:TRINITY_DN340_c0_g1_i1.p1 TRINITY_DN340_c0_g1~~TRINITY_DN340_c0_g1_i1.p1  ORF type:complete len:401 (-),score=98.09 TRINITY_DN340_c0_g1_i1:63-1265(-)